MYVAVVYRFLITRIQTRARMCVCVCVGDVNTQGGAVLIKFYADGIYTTKRRLASERTVKSMLITSRPGEARGVGSIMRFLVLIDIPRAKSDRFQNRNSRVHVSNVRTKTWQNKRNSNHSHNLGRGRRRLSSSTFISNSCVV